MPQSSTCNILYNHIVAHKPQSRSHEVYLCFQHTDSVGTVIHVNPSGAPFVQYVGCYRSWTINEEALIKVKTPKVLWPGYLTVHDSQGPEESCTVRYPGTGELTVNISF